MAPNHSFNESQEIPTAKMITVQSENVIQIGAGEAVTDIISGEDINLTSTNLAIQTGVNLPDTQR